MPALVPRDKKDVKKLEHERLQGILQELLKEEENKYCADCEAKQPRWASWNIGVFLCIRCAGLHRNLGVHVSKVKSMTLDTWTPEQVQSMRVMGNAKARAVYECELPSMFRRPQTDQALEQFIRAKYEAKRYIMKDWVPPQVNIADMPSERKDDERKQPLATSQIGSLRQNSNLDQEAQTKPTLHTGPQSGYNTKKDGGILIDFSVSPPKNGNATFQSDSSVMSTKQPADPATTGLLDDLFGPIVSAPISSTNSNHNLITSLHKLAENSNATVTPTNLFGNKCSIPTTNISDRDIISQNITQNILPYDSSVKVLTSSSSQCQNKVSGDLVDDLIGLDLTSDSHVGADKLWSQNQTWLQSNQQAYLPHQSNLFPNAFNSQSQSAIPHNQISGSLHSEQPPMLPFGASNTPNLFSDLDLVHMATSLNLGVGGSGSASKTAPNGILDGSTKGAS